MLVSMQLSESSCFSCSEDLPIAGGGAKHAALPHRGTWGDNSAPPTPAAQPVGHTWHMLGAQPHIAGPGIKPWRSAVDSATSELIWPCPQIGFNT